MFSNAHLSPTFVGQRCGRSLQTLELKDKVSSKDYQRLVKGLKEAEKAVDTDGSLAGLELRLCPQCNVRIEKNDGCNHMVWDVYRAFALFVVFR